MSLYIKPVDMRNSLLIIIFLFACNALFAQNNDTTWAHLRTFENDYYSFKVPIAWRSLGKLADLASQAFDATAIYFADSINNEPVFFGVFVSNQPADSLEEVKTICVDGYAKNPDRIFPDGFHYNIQDYILSSGQKAYIFNTRFYRATRELNQSRFDLIVYSRKARQGFLYTISIQYKDDTYSFEDKNHLDALAKKIYSYFSLK